jgi:hypothetical protein
MKYSARREIAFYGLALALAWGVRLAFLGRVPLSDVEASLALQALNLARGQEVLLGPHPAYLLLTGAWIWLFGAGEGVARFWPAVLGGLVVLTPLFFQRQLGRRAAIWLAFFLAFDPGLVAVSRQAGSMALVVTFVLFAAGLWLARRPVLAGIAGGLALLGGPQIWPVLLVLAITRWATGWRENPRRGAVQGVAQDQVQNTASDTVAIQERPAWHAVLWAALATVLLVGSLFFIFPRGLSAMAASLPAYFSVWTSSSGLSIGLLLAALLFYEIFPLVFGGFGMLSGRNHAFSRFLSVWAFAALALAIIPPGRSPEGLLWAVIPLLALAARQVDGLLRLPAGDRLPALGQAVLAAAILIFISLDMVTITDNIRIQRDAAPEMIALAGALVLLLATALLVAWGWSGRIAVFGVIYSLLAFLLVFNFSAAWNGAGLSKRGTAEIWRTGPQFVDADLLRSTLRNFETWNIHGKTAADVVIVDLESPALRWALRDIPRASYVNFLPSSVSPAMVITPDQQELGLAAEYRGQSLILGQQPGWAIIRPHEWVRWLYFREIPLDKQNLILWVRTDLFPDDPAE